MASIDVSQHKDAVKLPRNSAAVEPEKDNGDGRCVEEDGGSVRAEIKPLCGELSASTSDASHVLSKDTECSPAGFNASAKRSNCEG